MRKIFFILLLISCGIAGSAQWAGWRSFPVRSQQIGLMADSLQYIPLKDTTHTPIRKGALTMRPQDSTVYVGISTTAAQKWMRVLTYTDFIDTSGKFISGMWRVPGIDSIYWGKGGVVYSIKDSSGLMTQAQYDFLDSLRAGQIADSSYLGLITGPTTHDSLYAYYKPYGAASWDSAYQILIPKAGGGGSGTVNSGSQYRIAYYATAGTTLSEAAAITANRAIISDANGVPTHSSVTATQLGYVDATSSIQTQIDSKLNKTDTAAMLSNYPQRQELLDSIAALYNGMVYLNDTTVLFTKHGGGAPDTLRFTGGGVSSSYTFNSPLIEIGGAVDLDTAAGKWRSEGYLDTKYAQQNSNWFIINQWASVQTDARFYVKTFRTDSTVLFGSHGRPVTDNAYEWGSTSFRWSTVHTGIIRNVSGVGLRLSTTDILKLTSSGNIVIGNSGADNGTGRELQITGQMGVSDTAYFNAQIKAPNINSGTIAANSYLGLNATGEVVKAAGGSGGATVGTYTERLALSPSNGTEFYQTDDSLDAPAGKYYYLLGEWTYTPLTDKLFYEFYDEFYNTPSSGQSNGYFFNTNSGGSASVAAGISGVVELNTGTTSSSRVVLITGANGSPGNTVTLGNGAVYIKCRIYDIPTLGDGTDDYNLRVGLGNTLSGVFNSGVWVEYSSGTSANWRYATSNGGSSTINTSGTAVTTGAHDVEILINAAGSSAGFWVDGTHLGTITTNISTTVAIGHEIQLQKTAGTNARTVKINSYQSWQRFTTARN